MASPAGHGRLLCPLVLLLLSLSVSFWHLLRVQGVLFQLFLVVVVLFFRFFLWIVVLVMVLHSKTVELLQLVFAFEQRRFALFPKGRHTNARQPETAGGWHWKKEIESVG